MARTESMMMELGTTAPDFSLLDTISGQTISLGDFKDIKGLLVVFTCNHCPFAIHVQEQLVQMAKDFQENEIGVVAISPNDVEKYPDDSPEKMKEQAEKFGFTFPYLFDETQEVAKAYSAACTPDFYLFDENFKLVYRGQIDGSRPGNDKPVNGEDMRAAVETLLSGGIIDPDQTPSLGCNIKWKPGNEPNYFGSTAIKK